MIHRPLKCHPFRQYHLYLCNYRAHQAKKRLSLLIESYQNQLPAIVISELIQTRDQIKLIHELENPR